MLVKDNAILYLSSFCIHMHSNIHLVPSEDFCKSRPVLTYALLYKGGKANDHWVNMVSFTFFQNEILGFM